MYKESMKPTPVERAGKKRVDELAWHVEQVQSSDERAEMLKKLAARSDAGEATRIERIEADRAALRAEALKKLAPQKSEPIKADLNLPMIEPDENLRTALKKPKSGPAVETMKEPTIMESLVKDMSAARKAGDMTRFNQLREEFKALFALNSALKK